MPDDLGQGNSHGVMNAVAAFTLDVPTQALPATTRARAALLMLDTLGVCIAAQPMEAGRIAREAACRMYGAAAPGDQAPMLFDGRRVSRAGAAFAAASQIDNLDAHDGYNPTKGHIGVAVVPALAALGHDRPGLSGPDALAALVVGYEVAGRAATALHASVEEYHTSGAWNALGVAAMAARLDSVAPEVLRQSLGIAEFHGPRSQMMREIATPTMLHDGSGMGALVGMSAHLLATLGFTGAPAITVEGEEVAGHWADLGTTWQTDLQYIKPYPICRWAHAAIDAVRLLRAATPFKAGDITGVTIRTFHNAAQLSDGMPGTTSEAQYSLPFAVATMAAHGEITLPRIAGEGLRDPAVARLVGLTRVETTDRHEARYPLGRWADVTIELSDGRRLESGDTHAHGGPEHPWGAEEIRAKFHAMADPVVGPDRAQAIWTAGTGLTDAASSFSDFVALLTAAPDQT